MLSYFADKLTLVSLAPFWSATVGLALSVVGSFLAWIASDAPWAGIMFAISLPLAVWTYTESRICRIAGFGISLYCFYLLFGLNVGLENMRPLPEGCTMIDGRTPEECIEDIIRRAESAAHESPDTANPL